MLRRPALAIVLAVACPAAVLATESDPLRTPACREALAVLESEQAAAASRAPDTPLPPTSRQRIERAQRAASVACLRGEPDPQPPPRTAAPAISVPGIDVSPAPRRDPPRPTSLPSAPTPPSGPQTITACDAIGCWTNDGTRLQRAGPGLLGPRGPCTTVGAIVSCP